MENSTLAVVYEQANSGVKGVMESKAKVLATDEGIRVTDVDTDEVIQVYNIEGFLQQKVRANSTQVDIPLSKDNVYIVKVGKKTVKLRL